MHKGTRYPRQEPIPRENRESANDSLTFTVEEALILGRRLQARETLAIFQTLFNWFGTKVVALFNAWRRSWNEAKSIKLLSRLDDRTLRDIGIDHRSQILSFVREWDKDNTPPIVSQKKNQVIPLETRTSAKAVPQTDRAA